jgi:hypothetical protein
MSDDTAQGEKPPSGALVDVKLTATDLAGIGRAGERLVDALGAGLGPTVRHWLNTLFQRAEQGATKRWFETARGAGLTPTELEYRSVEGRTDLRIKAEHIRQQQSREAVGAYALQEMSTLRGQGKIASDPPGAEPEWLNRFWRLAQDISRDDLRSLWGRLLARQATTADRVGARTLDSLSLLDAWEMSQLERWASFRFDNGTEQGVIYYFHLEGGRHFTPLESLGQRMQALVGVDVQGHLTSIGLLNPTMFQPSFPRFPESREVTIGPDRFLLGYTRDPGERVGILGVGFTPTGRDILSLVQPARSDAYLSLLREGLAVFGCALTPIA